MRSGKLDRKITIQEPTTGFNEYGAPSSTWADVRNLRAELIEESTEEFLANYGARDEAVRIFRTRYVAGITTSMAVLFDGDRFNIKEISNIGRRKGLELRCVEVRHEG